MSEIRQRFIEELRLCGLSPSSIDIYVRCVRQLAEFCRKNPLDITNEEVRGYLLHLRAKNIAVKTYNVTVAALNRFFELCAAAQNRPRFKQIPAPLILPDVFSVEEVKRLLENTASLKYKTILSLMYSAGLRVGECVRLRADDIDSKRMLIRVKQAKGNRDRYAVFGNSALSLLREYYRQYRPAAWLFPGSKNGEPLHIRSVQKVFRLAVRDAGIKKHVRPHTLRHSFATHLLEQKCPLPAIQRFLGHAYFKSTLMYMHVTPRALADIVNPLDALMTNAVGEVKHG